MDFSKAAMYHREPQAVEGSDTTATGRDGSDDSRGGPRKDGVGEAVAHEREHVARMRLA